MGKLAHSNQETMDEIERKSESTNEPDVDNFRWISIGSPEELEIFYTETLQRIQDAARECGYAIAVHGSMRRDLDLIAAPWIAEHSDAETLCRTIHRAACGLEKQKYTIRHDKPCGRHGDMFPICWIDYPHAHDGSGHIDLAIMPDVSQLETELADARAALRDLVADSTHVFGRVDSTCPECIHLNTARNLLAKQG